MRMTACLLGYYYILTSEEYIFVVPAESVPSLLSKFFTRTSKQGNEGKREHLNVIAIYGTPVAQPPSI